MTGYEPKVVLGEPGARWAALAWGPALCLAGAGVEGVGGLGVHTLGWSVAAVVLVGMTALPVLGARQHASVELTVDRLRQGVEVVALADVREVLPADPAGRAPWQLTRALGASSTVPRGCAGIGLVLHDGRTVQAWARDEPALRAALLAQRPDVGRVSRPHTTSIRPGEDTGERDDDNG